MSSQSQTQFPPEPRRIAPKEPSGDRAWPSQQLLRQSRTALPQARVPRPQQTKDSVEPSPSNQLQSSSSPQVTSQNTDAPIPPIPPRPTPSMQTQSALMQSQSASPMQSQSTTPMQFQPAPSMLPRPTANQQSVLSIPETSVNHQLIDTTWSLATRNAVRQKNADIKIKKLETRIAILEKAFTK